MLSSKVKVIGSNPFPPVIFLFSMKLNLNFEYDKLHLKEVVILIPKYHPNMVSFLTPVLGLYGINVKEFINEFNIKTRFVKFDIIVPVRVKISKIKTFEILVKTPYVSSIVSNLPSFSSGSKLNLLSIYKISLVKSLYGSFFMLSSQKKIYSSLRQYLSLISNSSSSIRLKPSFISPNSSFLQYTFAFNFSSKIWKALNLLRISHYGAFLTFNSANSSKVNYLVNSLGLMGLNITKVPSVLFPLFLPNQKLYGNVYYVGSDHFAKIAYFFNILLNRKPSSGLFINYFRFNGNIFSISFLQHLFRSYFKLNKAVIVLKIIRTLNTIIVKLLSKNLFKIMYLLKKHHANLPSNIA